MTRRMLVLALAVVLAGAGGAWAQDTAAGKAGEAVGKAGQAVGKAGAEAGKATGQAATKAGEETAKAAKTTAKSATSVMKMRSTSETATVTAIDKTKRTITLKDDKGQEDTFTVEPAVQRFDEINVGDKVTATYYEAILLQARKPGEKADTATVEAAAARAKSELPAGAIAVRQTMTVTVKAIDMAAPSITVTTPDGRTAVRKVEDKRNLEGVHVGDKIDITYDQAVVATVERAK